jgi:hypothetical protein
MWVGEFLSTGVTCVDKSCFITNLSALLMTESLCYERMSQQICPLLTLKHAQYKYQIPWVAPNQ